MKNDDRHPKDVTWADDFTGDDYHGYALAYGVRTDDLCIKQCEYRIITHWEPHPEVRGYRQDQRLRGRRTKPLPKEALRDELVVLPGAGMTAEEIVAGLHHFIREIQKNGLFVGKARNDLFCVERINRKPQFVASDSDVPIEES